MLCVGTRLEEFQTGLGRYLPAQATLIRVDVDAFEVARNVHPDLAIVGDAKLVLGQLEAAASAASGRPWTADLVAFKREFEERVELECALDGEDLKTKQIVHALNRVFDDGFVLVNENGGQDLWSYYCRTSR